jgi:hypothetical protein
MKSPFKMTPGRGNMPKTGRGISAALMSKSPMYQSEVGDIEYTGQGRMNVKKAQDRIKANPEKTAEYDSAMGLTRNPATNELSGNKYEKRYLTGVEGQNDRIVDGAGKVIAESKGTSPKSKELLKKEYERNKTYTESRRSDNSEGLNALQGSTKVDKLNDKQKKLLINTTNAKVSPANQMVKKSPMKQVSKITVKKTTAVPADKKPKASKTPINQMSKLKKKSC